MNRKYDYGMKGLLIAMLAAVMLGACATAPAPADASAEVRALAQARWDALVRGDVSAAYGYLSPASRASLSLLQYQQRIHVGFWKRAVVESVSCEPEVCKVGVNITYDYQMAKGVETSLSESWVKEDGKWWFVLKK
ncbi:MAG: hypothetical protein PHZ14_00010 [Sulfuricella sp.]|jgi:uncharacterized protein YchJ|nr:hypothetical protein [Sulfuricella sp.]